MLVYMLKSREPCIDLLVALRASRFTICITECRLIGLGIDHVYTVRWTDSACCFAFNHIDTLCTLF